MIISLTRAVLVACALSATPFVVSAQSQTPSNATQTTTPSGGSSATLTTAELSQLVAPIALYPDPLLTNVLMASTYPLEVVVADRFMKDSKNKTLKGDALKRAVEGQNWDKSVAELTATPDVLAMMSEQIQWTQKLGDAVLAQQGDVMDAIQSLRGRAQAENKLVTTKEQKVTTRRIENRDYIEIEPAVANTVYVPYYDPAVVYGAWPYPAYPAYYWPPAYGWGYYGGAALAAGIAFGTGWALASWGNWWGGSWGWHDHNIHVHRHDHNKWAHNKDRSDRNRNNANRDRGRDNQKTADRGRDNRQAGNRDGGKREAGNRNNKGNKQAQNRNKGGNKQAQNRKGNKQSAQNRNKGGNKQAQNRKGGNKSAQNRGSSQKKAAQQRGGQKHAGKSPRSGNKQFSGGNRGKSFASARGGGRSIGGSRGGISRGGGGGRGGGRGRRSDISVKHDIALLGYLPNGLGYYRFSYNGSDRAYVGVMAQEVQPLMPEAVQRDRDGVLRVRYDRLGIQFQTYEEWLRHGARIPAAVSVAQ
jgi:hypothetical protein